MGKYCCLRDVRSFVRRLTSQRDVTFHSAAGTRSLNSTLLHRNVHLYPKRHDHEYPQYVNSSRRLLSDRELHQRSIHDIGGSLISKNDIQKDLKFEDQPLLAWEQQCHALFVVLASRGILGTDELRRAIEALAPDQYALWGYYEKWSAAMVSLLMEKNVISEAELRLALFGPALLSSQVNDAMMAEPSPLFRVGDCVRVKPYASSTTYDGRSPYHAVEWRRPHIRTPGYIYGAVGVIERVCGRHGDPSFLAFGTRPAPDVQLYRVRFRQADLWPEQHHASSGGGDVVEVEIYEHWLESGSSSSLLDIELLEPIALFDHSEKGGDDCVGNHHHHHHDHGTTDAAHETRPAIEERSIRNEGPPRPGQELFQALSNLLIQKGIVLATDIRVMCEKLDTAGKRLDGATLVVAAWMDDTFRKRLLDNPAAAAAELGIATSNANAPTVLTVVPNRTNVVHNLIVCTLCSCYPSGLLGIAPSWYKSRLYRARAVRFPRDVLASFGTLLAASTTIRVHDSTADHRYLVLPDRPSETDDWTADELRALVTRDSMIGVTVPTIVEPATAR
jgi:nitrile hydratase subunit alpha